MAFTAVFSTSALAQQSSTAISTASTTIVAPIAISNVTPMAFGSFASGGAGKLVLSSAGLRTPSGGVKVTTVTGSPTAAEFTVSGQGSYAYTVTLPTTAYTLSTTATGTVQTMDVDTFTSSLANGGGTLDATTGKQNFTVGATLNVKAAQVVGTYANTTGFNVTVNYN